MATLVSFHAHPNDDTTTCGGVMRKAHEDGHRVVLVLATRGELGYLPEGLLDEGEELWQRRAVEAQAAADVLGVDRLVFLGYTDSGMTAVTTDGAAGTFRAADVEEAAVRLAAILREEDADVLTVYDENGTYGDPDHIQVHRVGLRAAELAGTPKVYQSTISREHIKANQREYAETAGVELPSGPEFGTPDAEITCVVDVSAYTEYKRKALLAHASQITPQSKLFTDLPEEKFRPMFGTEWFIRAGQGPGVTETDLMA
ncbi:PIG-L deacetylase family protein [Micromonospora sp. NPDC051925]|uniref:PIG-L deacetylase family protein n=1 Tax=Micromonospora sp. NPDC051925 TaxID=3364288 RepID=UPI0037C6DB0A